MSPRKRPSTEEAVVVVVVVCTHFPKQSSWINCVTMLTVAGSRDGNRGRVKQTADWTYGKMHTIFFKPNAKICDNAIFSFVLIWGVTKALHHHGMDWHLLFVEVFISSGVKFLSMYQPLLCAWYAQVIKDFLVIASVAFCHHSLLLVPLYEQCYRIFPLLF